MCFFNFIEPKRLEPQGWLKKQLQTQADGLNGNLDKVWPDVRDSKWLGGECEGWERLPARALWGYGWGWPAFAGITAFHLHCWYSVRRFCGRCATPLLPGERERSLVCPECGHVEYPSIPPSVLVAVRDGERLLLTRYNRPGTPRYVLVAGYVEAGETAEQAAAREVLEETGVHIKNLRYIGSQPWGLSGTLSLAFSAELDGPDAITRDEEELSEACWMPRKAIPPVPNEESITMRIISAFRRGEW